MCVPALEADWSIAWEDQGHQFNPPKRTTVTSTFQITGLQKGTVASNTQRKDRGKAFHEQRGKQRPIQMKIWLQQETGLYPGLMAPGVGAGSAWGEQTPPSVWDSLNPPSMLFWPDTVLLTFSSQPTSSVPSHIRVNSRIYLSYLGRTEQFRSSLSNQQQRFASGNNSSTSAPGYPSGTWGPSNSPSSSGTPDHFWLMTSWKVQARVINTSSPLLNLQFIHWKDT